MPTNPGFWMRTLLFLSTAWIALPILVAQNLFGMYLNLWLDFSRYSSIPSVFTSAPAIDVHVALGILILAITSGRLAIGMLPQYRALRTPSVLIFIFALLAFTSGVTFTFYGNDDLYSFTMEIGFGGIVVSVAFFLYLANKIHR